MRKPPVQGKKKDPAPAGAQHNVWDYRALLPFQPDILIGRACAIDEQRSCRGY